MEFNYIEDGIDAVVIDNFYTEDQLKEIMLELKWLTKPTVLSSDRGISAARDLNTGNLITSKNGVFLENIFKDYRHSAIITHGIKQMDLDLFKSKLISLNTLFKSFIGCDSRCHLVSYYENSQYYKTHIDSFFFTVLSYFYTEPKQFDGGELVLSSCNSNKKATVEVKNNRVVIIASSTPHEVLEIKSKLNNTFSGDGRYCVATFLSVMPQSEKEENDSN
jgi:hypothetical protein